MRFLLNRKIYIILAIILVIGCALEFTRSEFVLRMSSNISVAKHSAQTEKIDALTAEQVASLNRLQWHLVYDESDEDSEMFRSNASIVLKQMKQPLQESRYDQFRFPADERSAVIVTISDLDMLSDVEELAAYVERGGYVLFMRLPIYSDSLLRIYRKLGINEMGGYYVTDGLNIVSNVLAGSSGESYTSVFTEDSVQFVKLDEESEVLITDTNHVPIMWERKLGQGKVTIYNGFNLNDQACRGILAGAISRLTPDFAYPVINAKLMYIDDFPAPLPEGVNPAIYKQYRRDIPTFYRDIWWPDMIRIANRHDLLFTAVVIESYQAVVTPSFADPEDSNVDQLVMYGREVLKNNGEIGIHGYNHQALHMDQRIMDVYGYKAWREQSYMTDSIKTVLEYIDYAFPWHEPVTYVPPSNSLSDEGREALKEAWPHLDNISSVFLGDTSSGLNVTYLQEFGIADDGIAEMPRITSGYHDSDELRWVAANLINTVGVFSHFVHPDDILDAQRSFGGRGWEELMRDFERFLGVVNEQFGWLRPMTSRDASGELRKWAESEPYLVPDETGITGYINQYAGDQYFILRTDRKIGRLENCDVKKIDEQVYLVHVTDANFKIGLGRLQ